jgi:hypothetical protein
MAPGQRRRIALSTISLVAIESVSAASAIPRAAATAVPARNKGTSVSR